MDDRLLCNDAEFWRIYLHDLELDLPHTTTASECVALTYWSVGFAEVRSEENIEEVASEAFDGIRDGEDSDARSLEILASVFTSYRSLGVHGLTYLMSGQG